MNMHLWNCDLQKKHYPILDRLKEIGFDGIEFFFGSPDRESYRELGNYAKSIDLKVINVLGANTEVSAISEDAEVRKAADVWIRENIDNVVMCGGTNLGGPFHCPVGFFPGHPPREVDLDRAATFLRKAGDYAAEKGITLTPEFLNRYETFLASTMQQGKQLLDRVGHPAVSAMFDTYHSNIEEKSQTEAIEDIRPYLTHVHISENDRGTPGRGQIDFDPVFAKLKEINYSGTVAIEAFGLNDPGFALAVKVWRDFSPEEQIITEGYQLVRDGLAKHQLS